jgi:hypothetical protein
MVYVNEIGTPSTDSGIAVENIEVSATHLRFREAEQVEIRLPRFCVFDGSSRVVIEARNEEDALYAEMGWELICACES